MSSLSQSGRESMDGGGYSQSHASLKPLHHCVFARPWRLCEKHDLSKIPRQRRQGLAKTQCRMRSSRHHRLELERRRQDAIPESRLRMAVTGSISIFEHVSKVCIALTTQDFRSNHPVGSVFAGNHGLRDRRPETRPTRRRFELVLRSEQRPSAGCTEIHPGLRVLRKTAFRRSGDHGAKRHGHNSGNGQGHDDRNDTGIHRIASGLRIQLISFTRRRIRKML